MNSGSTFKSYNQPIPLKRLIDYLKLRVNRVFIRHFWQWSRSRDPSKSNAGSGRLERNNSPWDSSRFVLQTGEQCRMLTSYSVRFQYRAAESHKGTHSCSRKRRLADTRVSGGASSENSPGPSKVLKMIARS